MNITKRKDCGGSEHWVNLIISGVCPRCRRIWSPPVEDEKVFERLEELKHQEV